MAHGVSGFERVYHSLHGCGCEGRDLHGAAGWVPPRSRATNPRERRIDRPIPEGRV